MTWRDDPVRAWLPVVVGLAALFLVPWACQAVGEDVELFGDGPSEDDHPPTWEPRREVSVAAAGNRLFLYGGRDEDGRLLPDAASFNRLTDELVVLPEPPVPPLTPAEVVAVPGGAVVIGLDATGRYAGAWYSVDEERWQVIDLPERVADVRDGEVQAVGSTSEGPVVRLGGRVWTYVLGNAEWTLLPDVGAVGDACLAGDTVVATTAADVFTWSLGQPSTEWTRAPRAPVGGRLTCGVGTVVRHEPGRRPAVLTLGQRWRRPDPDRRTYRDVLWTGQHFVFVPPDGGRPTGYLPSAQVWFDPDLEPVDVVEPLWSGDRIVGWPRDGYATEPIG